MTYPSLPGNTRAYAQDTDRDNGQAGIVFPTSRGWRPNSAGLTAQRAVYVRGVVSRPMKIHSIAFVTTVAAGANDNVDVGILDASLKSLATSGSTAGKLNATPGRQTVALTADVVLLPRTVYYACLTTGTFGGTAASLACVANDASNFALLAGAAVPAVDNDFQNTTFPLPTPGATTTATGVNALNSATVNVGSTTGFPTTGAFLMGGVITTYTGVTATSFTGCGNHAATTGGEVITPSISVHGSGANNPVLLLIEAS